MPIRVYKKTSAGRRNSSVNIHAEVTKKKPEKTLLKPKIKDSGRNHHGKITVHSRGGGAKQRYRVIDFKRNKDGVTGKIIGIEYDPNRTCHIALVEYADGELRYILAPVGITDGDTIESAKGTVEPKVGNCTTLAHIPAGLNVHNIEMIAGRGGQLCRSAGTYARLTNKEAGWATLVFPSGEIRQIALECRATIGQVGNTDHQHVVWGKAGRSRHKGIRPHIRGMATNHNDHPLGGGSGRSKKNRPPVSMSGVLAKGGKTRNPKRPSNKRIIRRRFSVRFGQLTV